MVKTILKQLLSEYGTELYQFCYRLALNKADADDLYQDTFLKAMQLGHKLVRSDNGTDWQSIKDANRKNRNFLMGIAANLWKNQWRKKKIRQSLSIDAYTPDELPLKSNEDMEANYEQQELFQELQRSIDALPEKLKLVICMYYTADMKIDEIAKNLHIPKGTVNSRLHLAKKQLRKRLEARGYEL